MTTFRRACFPTAAGAFAATFSERGLTRLEFPGHRGDPAANAAPLPATQRRWLRLTARAVARVLAGRAPTVLPPLDERGTPFQREVWRALRGIPPGQTRTYAEVAQAVGRGAGAARAVGQACAANPIPVLTPCHRVLAAGGGWGGFSGGLAWKKRLVTAEAAAAGRARLRVR